MKSNTLLRYVILCSILFITVSCDQLSKRLVRTNVADHEYISLIRPYVTLTKVENSGAFLSLGSTLPYALRVLLLTFLPVFTLTFVSIYVLRKVELSNKTSIAIALIVGGGIGNLFDRIVYGSVTDFLHIDFILFQTGIFNIADVFIMMGLFLIVWGMIKMNKRPIHEQS